MHTLIKIMSEKPETLEKNWTKIGVMIALLSFIVATILGVAALSNFDISLKYFTIISFCCLAYLFILNTLRIIERSDLDFFIKI